MLVDKLHIEEVTPETAAIEKCNENVKSFA
jgi:hypothetical protein